MKSSKFTGRRFRQLHVTFLAVAFVSAITPALAHARRTTSGIATASIRQGAPATRNWSRRGVSSKARQTGSQTPTQTPPQNIVESGTYNLHKLEYKNGEESYSVAKEGDDLVLRSTFGFTDRGRHVPLTATLKMSADLTPEFFEIKGSVSRFSTIDSGVTVSGNTASLREGKDSRNVPLPKEFFTLGGYAPISAQMMFIRYLVRHQVKGPIQVFPGANVTVERRGEDTIKLNGLDTKLDRYSVNGLIWGREELWVDAEQKLAAAITVDGEFDHFEAVRPDLESNLAFFVSRAAEDEMAQLSEMAAGMSPLSKKPIAITGALLVDGTNNAPVSDSVVIIENGRITAAGPSASVKIPKGAMVIDAKGRTVMPGLWDMHAHFEQVEWGPVYLAAGVTTVRDVGNEFEFIKAVRDSIRDGKGLGPRLLLAGIVDGDGPVAFGIVHANTPQEAHEVVTRYKEAGFQQIKIYSSVKPEIVKAICDEAHKVGMTVTGHIPEGMNAYQGVDAGMDQINHIQYIFPLMLPAQPKAGQNPALPQIDFDSPEAKKAIDYLKSHGTVIDPTLSIFEWAFHPSNVPFSNYDPGAAKLPVQLSGAINNSGVPPTAADRTRAIFDQFVAVTGALHKAGIPIVAGTDQVVPGHSLHRELELYVKAGFTPLEAIQSATIVPARIMKVDREVGTIEVGKAADLIIIDGDPLADIRNTRNVRTVIAGGRIFDAATLWKSVGFQP